VKLESELIYPKLAREEIIFEQLNETLEDLLIQLKNERIQKETVVFTATQMKKKNRFWRLGAKRNKSRRNGPTRHKKIRM
jgi:hypothetical protein